MKNKEIIRKTFIWFFIYSVVGWIYEVIIYLVDGHGFVNRGFLFGPYLPVYGFGGLIILFSLHKLLKKKVKVCNINIMPLIIFLLIVVITSVLEYFTSLFAEYILHVELWNYSNWTINFQNRVALVPSLRFGGLGILFLYIVNPIMDKIYDKINNNTKSVIFTLMVLIMLVDLIIKII